MLDVFLSTTLCGTDCWVVKFQNETVTLIEGDRR